MADKKKSDEDDLSFDEREPDRPLECSECKKPISVYYTEVVGDTINHLCMCTDCPELQKKLHGEARLPLPSGIMEGTTGLACGNCGTTLEALHVGTSLGCSNCYEVFGDILLSELLAAEKIPPRLGSPKKSIPIHIGRTPGQATEMSTSLRLLALNEALNETLKREDYEQAAWLRDQIKALTENPEKEGGDEGKQ